MEPKAEARLRALRRRRSPSRAELHALLEQLRADPPDAVLMGEVRELLTHTGRTLPADIDVWQPRVGSTYLLLAGGGGNTGRILARREGPPYQRRLDASERARAQLNQVFDTLVAALAARGAGPPDAAGRGHRIDLQTPGAQAVDGDSLGLSLAVALVSQWTGTPPRADTAASAAVVGGGKLATVTQLPTKLAALQRRYPAVRRVVVARTQVGEPPPGIELVPADDLPHALREHGLDLASVAGRTHARDVRRAINGLRYEVVADNDAREWRRLAQRARTLAHQLAVKDPRALGYAALFHLHAGDATEAAELFAQLDERDLTHLPGGARAELLVNAASGRIDTHPEAAVEAARRALEAAQALRGEEREESLGKALGTYGRALVHAGRPEHALQPLRDAVAHHAAHRPEETARSQLYLALGLRRAGQPGAALEIAREALAAAGDDPRTPTALFAEYELARCHLELGETASAVAALRRVVAGQAHPTAYPRAGCLRYLVRLALHAGDPAPSELDEALHHLPGTSGALRRVLAAALAEALVLSPSPLLPERLARTRNTWRTHLGNTDPQSLLATLVY